MQDGGYEVPEMRLLGNRVNRDRPVRKFAFVAKNNDGILGFDVRRDGGSHALEGLVYQVDSPEHGFTRPSERLPRMR